MSLSGLARESNEKKVQALTLCFSRETLSIVQNLRLSSDEMKDVTTIIAAIKKYIDGHVNESVECRNFRRRTQQLGECFDNFLLALRDLVKTCNFCSNECMRKNIRDQVIEGILDGDTVENLLQVKDLSLDKTIQICQAQKAAKKQRANTSSVHQELVAAVRTPQTHHRKSPFHTTPNYPPICQGWVAKYTQGVEQDAQHSNSHVTVVANWATLRKCAVADTLHQNPTSLYQQHPLTSFQLVKIH